LVNTLAVASMAASLKCIYENVPTLSPNMTFSFVHNAHDRTCTGLPDGHLNHTIPKMFYESEFV
jgi:hypothetical protein